MKKWTVGRPDRKIVSELSIKCGISSLAAAVLASRGFSSPDQVMSVLNSSELSDPFLITDMEIAADTINDAIDNGLKICVYGDYDCDGIMSTVMLYSYLLETGADVFYYIPERSEGYGLNKTAVDSIADQGAELIITVDNGISAIDEADYIYEKGMRLVVTDHHQPGDSLPRAEAVVDPHRSDCFSPFKFLCGAGVALKLIAALDGGDYTMALEQFGDLAAIATVADIVSITGENRFIVAYGMQLIENSDRPSIMALKQVCGLSDKPVDTFSVGFGLGPRINASGRFGSPSMAAELFLSEDYDDAFKIASELDSLNNMRKKIESAIMEEISSVINNNPQLLNNRVLFLCGKGWHHGVIGIVASKIMEKFGRPCFIASEENGEIRGSVRSFGGFSAFEALKYCSDCLEKFGGHPGAGGFTVKHGMTDKFNELLQKYALEFHKDMPVMTINADAPVSAAELTVQNIRSLKQLEPFGADNEKPLFFIDNAVAEEITPLSGGAHTKVRFKLGFAQFDALVFHTAPDELCFSKGDTCRLVASLEINSFRGKESVSVYVKDCRPASFEQSKILSANSAFRAFMRDEALPKNFYPRMAPSRDEAVECYKLIPAGQGIGFDALFSKLKNPNINYCKLSVIIEALRQLGLVSVSYSAGKVSRVAVTEKKDLMSAPILVKLNQMQS